MKVLVDECLTVDLVAVANQAGLHGEHIAHTGKAGWSDWNIVRYAIEMEFVLVTNNAADFRVLYAAEELHPGLVILIPTLGRRRQQALFRAVLAEMNVSGEPLNQVIEADLSGDEVLLTITQLPRPES